MYQIPICPFSQRVLIMLALKELAGAIDFQTVDITKPRPDWLLEKTGGSTAMPILELEGGEVIKESLVILRYVEERYAARPIARADPYERAVENMLIAASEPLIMAGYTFLLNQERARRATLEQALLRHYAALSEFLTRYGSRGPYLFDRFGYAELVYAPFFQRFYFLEYYEGFTVPAEPRFARARAWIEACVAHPRAQQVSREEVVKLYYDYAKGAGNGALLPGRQRSSFAFSPGWRARPWPPRDKYGVSASDEQLGLL